MPVRAAAAVCAADCRKKPAPRGIRGCGAVHGGRDSARTRRDPEKARTGHLGPALRKMPAKAGAGKRRRTRCRICGHSGHGRIGGRHKRGPDQLRDGSGQAEGAPGGGMRRPRRACRTAPAGPPCRKTPRLWPDASRGKPPYRRRLPCAAACLRPLHHAAQQAAAAGTAPGHPALIGDRPSMGSS